MRSLSPRLRPPRVAPTSRGSSHDATGAPFKFGKRPEDSKKSASLSSRNAVNSVRALTGRWLRSTRNPKSPCQKAESRLLLIFQFPKEILQTPRRLMLAALAKRTSVAHPRAHLPERRPYHAPAAASSRIQEPLARPCGSGRIEIGVTGHQSNFSRLVVPKALRPRPHSILSQVAANCSTRMSHELKCGHRLRMS